MSTDDNETTSQPLPSVETAPDLEVTALVREHHDAGGCSDRWRSVPCDSLGCSGAEAIRRAIEAGRAPLLKRIEDMQDRLDSICERCAESCRCARGGSR